jgi:tyrosyl-tRNA synthetase
MRDPKDQLARIMRTADVALPEGALERQLGEGRPLRVKLGIDPTAPDVTLGWAVVFDLLRAFQDEGHTAVLILGDFTAQVGDPSGKASTRKRLSNDEVNAYADSCLPTVLSLLRDDNIEIRRNSEWLGAMDMHDVLELTSQITVSRIMDREDFAKRWRDQEPISMVELLYPLLQGSDSVAVEADVEIGGSDQLLNLLMGRDLQERAGQRPQSIVTAPLLVGTDGVNKMSQSLGNYISVRDDANEMFGKTMSIPDDAMPQWFRLAAGATTAEVAEISANLEGGTLHPGEAKRDLARRIADRYWGDGAGADAETAFDRLFRHGEAPSDVDEHALPADEDPVWLPGALSAAGLVPSNSEARRLIAQGAVKIDGVRVETESVPRERIVGRTTQVGKRRFVTFS